MTRARLRGKTFSCRHLSTGDQFCVNSDLSVACSCLDEDGSAILGNLEELPLDEILAGPKAREFRAKLAQGKLPTSTCLFCPGLKSEEPARAPAYQFDFSLAAREIFLENTVLCNLKCLSCPRETLQRRTGRSMSLNQVRMVADAIKSSGIQTVKFLNWGEPFLSPTILEELRILREQNPDITIVSSTNGLLLSGERKLEAAMLMDHIMFSIFGATQESAARYQRGTDFEKAYSNMKSVVAYKNARNLTRPLVEWKYVLFHWNDRRELITRAKRLAEDAGVDVLSFWPTAEPCYGISFRSFVGLDDDIPSDSSSGKLTVILKRPIAAENR